ncbi:hypothetical protein P12x_004191 [Tundrisphaera lichenicola]|uniref:hypothetical protein n=1 Tax=Tundrisphaera lichenicola TaxID=2029860 RepID=UPI003EBE45D2
MIYLQGEQVCTGRSRRRGLVSIVVLIALIVIALIGAGLLKAVLARRVEIGLEERRIQATWLAESALDRAEARLAESSDYQGESWEISAQELGNRGSGTVLIQVEEVPEHFDRRRVRIRADFPNHSIHRARQSLEAVLSINRTSR